MLPSFIFAIFRPFHSLVMSELILPFSIHSSTFSVFCLVVFLILPPQFDKNNPWRKRWGVSWKSWTTLQMQHKTIMWKFFKFHRGNGFEPGAGLCLGPKRRGTGSHRKEHILNIIWLIQRNRTLQMVRYTRGSNLLMNHCMKGWVWLLACMRTMIGNRSSATNGTELLFHRYSRLWKAAALLLAPQEGFLSPFLVWG